MADAARLGIPGYVRRHIVGRQGTVRVAHRISP